LKAVPRFVGITAHGPPDRFDKIGMIYALRRNTDSLRGESAQKGASERIYRGDIAKHEIH
jgi:hypothetical protein